MREVFPLEIQKSLNKNGGGRKTYGGTSGAHSQLKSVFAVFLIPINFNQGSKGQLSNPWMTENSTQFQFNKYFSSITERRAASFIFPRYISIKCFSDWDCFLNWWAKSPLNSDLRWALSSYQLPADKLQPLNACHSPQQRSGVQEKYLRPQTHERCSHFHLIAKTNTKDPIYHSSMKTLRAKIRIFHTPDHFFLFFFFCPR